MLREGGGLIDLARADNPLLFASPTGISFPVNGGAAHGRRSPTPAAARARGRSTIALQEHARRRHGRRSADA